MSMQQRPRVSIASLSDSNDYDVLVKTTLDLVGGLSSYVRSGQRVFIKPNVCGGVPSKPGSYTNTQVLAALLTLLHEQGAQVSVGEADSCMYAASVMLHETHVSTVAEKTGAEIVNLSQGDMVTITVDNGFVFDKIKVNKVIADADVLIALPVMKTHISTTVTLGMKTMFGVLPEKKKSRYHPKLDQIMVDVTSALPPHLTIIDATTAMEGEGPFKGDPLELGLLIAGDNVVSTDACGATIMGFDPSSIDHLRLAHRKKLGIINVQDMDIQGQSIESVKHPFIPAPSMRADRTVSRISTELGYRAIHRHYEHAVKSWKARQT
jgi:uncharacterized protein (DUF362 family)